MTTSNLCAIVGLDYADESALRNELERLVTECGVVEVVSGLHRGIEMQAAAIALELRRKYPLKLWIILESEEQCIDWDEHERDKFYQIAEQSDYQMRVDNAKNDFSRTKQIEAMCRDASIILATADAVEQLKYENKTLILHKAE